MPVSSEDSTQPAAPDQITPEQVAHVAHLARLELTPEQQALFAEQLSSVLAYGRDMNALDLTEVEPTSHPLALRNVLRDDVAGAPSHRDEVLGEAPDSEAGQFSVPPVLESNP